MSLRLYHFVCRVSAVLSLCCLRVSFCLRFVLCNWTSRQLDISTLLNFAFRRRRPRLQRVSTSTEFGDETNENRFDGFDGHKRIRTNTNTFVHSFIQPHLYTHSSACLLTTLTTLVLHLHSSHNSVCRVCFLRAVNRPMIEVDKAGQLDFDRTVVNSDKGAFFGTPGSRVFPHVFPRYLTNHTQHYQSTIITPLLNQGHAVLRGTAHCRWR